MVLRIHGMDQVGVQFPVGPPLYKKLRCLSLSMKETKSNSIKSDYEHQQIHLETRDDGNLIVLSGGNEQEMLNKALIICEILNKSPLPKNSNEDLSSGEALRPQGAFAVFSMKGQIFIQNRNARNNVAFNEEMKRAVDKVL